MAKTPISEIGEFGLIDRIKQIADKTQEGKLQLKRGIGDDCAVIEPLPNHLTVISTDVLIEQIHFDLLTTPLEHLGAKAISVNVSDICAMNAIPRYATVSLGLSARQSVEDVETFYHGLCNAAMHYGVAIVGGDTSASVTGFMISISIVGETTPDKIAYRSGAKEGDPIFVTGDLGSSYAGLKILMRERKLLLEAIEENVNTPTEELRLMLPDLKEYQRVIQKHLLPKARLDIIHFLAEKGIRPTSMIDISDGLGSELKHLSKASALGLFIEESKLPILSESREVSDEFEDDATVYALFGGEDYELLFTVSPEDKEKLEGYKELTCIGEMKPSSYGVKMKDVFGAEVDLMKSSGFTHFPETESGHEEITEQDNEDQDQEFPDADREQLS